MKSFTPFIFQRRGSVWTIVYPDADGTKRQRALKLNGRTLSGPDNKKAASELLRRFKEQRRAAALIDGDEKTGPMTVARWAGEWLKSREVKGISTVADYRSRLEHHVLPLIGHMRLDAVEPEHIAQAMQAALDKGLAPRTQRHVYTTMRSMFARAIPRLLAVNPCTLPPEDLPRKQDSDPEWRPSAIFDRDEVMRILTEEAIPLDRRTFYAVMFLGGLRFGEISALRVRHYAPQMEPLGQLQVGRSFNSKKNIIKGTKTERPRLVPVHPWLARLLGEWLAVGWREVFGRAPKPDDILIPTRNLTHRKNHVGWRQFNEDLERMGLRPRRQHDARRTFITLARGDGARKDLLRLVTHGAEGDIMDIYTEMPWASLCDEVAKLKLSPPAPEPLRSMPGLPPGCQVEKQPTNQEVTMRPQRDSNPAPFAGQVAPPDLARGLAAQGQGLGEGASNPEREPEGLSGSTATLATLALRQALAALEGGRVDVAIATLRRAIEAETQAARRAGGAS